MAANTMNQQPKSSPARPTGRKGMAPPPPPPPGGMARGTPPPPPRNTPPPAPRGGGGPPVARGPTPTPPSPGQARRKSSSPGQQPQQQPPPQTPGRRPPPPSSSPSMAHRASPTPPRPMTPSSSHMNSPRKGGPPVTRVKSTRVGAVNASGRQLGMNSSHHQMNSSHHQMMNSSHHQMNSSSHQRNNTSTMSMNSSGHQRSGMNASGHLRTNNNNMNSSGHARAAAGLGSGSSHNRSTTRASFSVSKGAGLGCGPGSNEMTASTAVDNDAIYETQDRTMTQMKKEYLKELNQQQDGPRFCSTTLLLIWMLTAGELLLDIGTNLIAFISFFSESECCGQDIDMGRAPIAVAIPYFVFIMIELGLLVASVVMHICGKGNANNKQHQQRGDSDRDLASVTDSWRDDGSTAAANGNHSSPFAANRLMRFLGWCVIVNPFFGCLVAWGLLYQSSKEESFVVLGLEGGALLLQWAAAYLEGVKLTRTALCTHLLPVLPFFILITFTLVYLHKGGVCYRNGTFWYEGCVVCDDGKPSSWNGQCDGMGQHQESYCSEDLNFCWFPYDKDPGEIPLRLLREQLERYF